MLLDIVWLIAVIIVTGSACLVSYLAGMSAERRRTRIRRERRVAAGIERREGVREGTHPARVTRASITGSQMQED